MGNTLISLALITNGICEIYIHTWVQLEVSDCRSCDAVSGPYGFISIAIDSYPKHDDEYRETYTSKLIEFLKAEHIVSISDDDFSKYIREFDEEFTMTKPKKREVESGVKAAPTSDIKTTPKNIVIESRISGMGESDIKKIHLQLNKQNVDNFNAGIRKCCATTGFELVCRSAAYKRMVNNLHAPVTDAIYYIKNSVPPFVVNEMNIFFRCINGDSENAIKRITISVTRDRDNPHAMFLTLEPDEGFGHITDGNFVITGRSFAESVFNFIWGIAQIPNFEVYTNNSDIDSRFVLFKEHEEVMFPKMMSLRTLAGAFVDSIGVPLRGENTDRINNFLNTTDVIFNIIKPHDKKEGYEAVDLPSIRIVCVDGEFKLVGDNHIAMDAMPIRGTDIVVYIENDYLRFTNCAGIEDVLVVRDVDREKCSIGMLHPLISLFLAIGVNDVVVEHQYANIFNVK